MTEHVQNVNYCILAVRDLERAKDRFALMGFTLTPRGRHPHRGTGNYCVMFADNYVELLGVVHGEGHEPLVEAQLAKGEGVGGIAFDTNDVRAAHAQLVGRGVQAAEPFQAQRDLELKTGPVSVRFEIVRIGSESTPYLSTFLCKHLDSPVVYHPDFLTHANGATGIDEFTIVVPRLDDIALRYERVFGSGKARTTLDSVIVDTGNCNLRFVTAAQVALLLPQGGPSAVLPHVARIVFRVGALGRVADLLRQASIPATEPAAGRLVVGADHGYGVAIEFTAVGRGVAAGGS